MHVPIAIAPSHGKKHIVQVAVELYEDSREKLKNARAVVTIGYSADALAAGIEQMVDSDAAMLTDCWAAYPEAASERPHVAMPSEGGANFQLLHWHIFNLEKLAARNPPPRFTQTLASLPR